MTKPLQELVDRLSNLPGPVRNAVVRAILRNVREYEIVEEHALAEVEGLTQASAAEVRCGKIK
jgi:hypothetical protein